MTQALIDAAQAHLREGRLPEALATFAELTQDNPTVAAHWRTRAVIEHQTGNPAAARISITRALQVDPLDAQAQLVAGHIAEDLQDPASARMHFSRATELRPDWAPAWSSQGTCLLESGKASEALACYLKVTELTPSAARGWNNVGMAQVALDRLDDAARAFNHAAALDARYALPRFNLARLHNMQGDVQHALERARESALLDPRHLDTQLLIGDLARRIRDYPLAAQGYSAAAALSTQPRAPLALADLAWEIGDDQRARAIFQQVEQQHPTAFRAAVGSRLMLPTVYESKAHLEETRERYVRGLAELEAMSDRFRWPSLRDALMDTRWTNFYLAYQGRPDRDLQASYGRFLHAVLAQSAPAWFEPRERNDTANRRIRVGFYSYFFFNCTAGRYFSSWIRGLDPARFEVFVYYTNAWVADDTKEIAAAASTFRHVVGRSPEVVAQRVRDDNLDVLVYPELGMNADTLPFAALRLAPVQVAGWGHPSTTGLPNIDWFLSSAAMEPAGAQSGYTERLSLLPGLGTRYARPTGEETGERADFGLPEGKHLYLVPQSLFKIHPDNDALLADVLARDPLGCLVLFAANHDNVTDRFYVRLSAAMRDRGIDPHGRVLLLPYMTHGAYLRLNRVCDVMLDTVHWSGGNTSLDALAGGLPVVTLPGDLMRGRQSRGMLEIIGVPELAVANAQAYAELAVAIASDADKRKDLSERILAGSDRLFDQQAPVDAFARFLEEAVRP